MTAKVTNQATAGDGGMHVVEPRAAGLAVRKGSVTASARHEMADWLAGRGGRSVAMEGAGVYWTAPYEALEAAN